MAKTLARTLIIFLLSAAGFPAAAQVEDPPILLKADKVSYDREAEIVTATGNVEISRDMRVLLADTITYDQRADLITASGNISLVEPTGDVIFAESMELSGDLKDAVAEGLSMLLKDGSRFASSGGRRTDANIIELRNVVYSPCNLCVEDPPNPPLWQIKAVKVVHDKNALTIEYTDAWLELWGTPIAYTPYFSHPDPTVKRRSGFLTPSIGGSSDLGVVTRTPYFFDIAPNRDATLTPIYTAESGPALAGEYRHRLMDGALEARASIANNDSGKLGTEKGTFGIRGHVAAKGRFDVNDTWRTGFDINRASDDTYMRRYGFSSDITINDSYNSLTTRLFTESFRGRNYFTVDAYAFQGLNEGDDSGDTPLVLPMIDFNHVGEPDRVGGRTSLDVNFLALTRTGGSDTQRLSLKGGWQVPFLGPGGGAYTLSTSLRGDAYHVDDLIQSGQDSTGRDNTFTGFSGRIRPDAALEWRQPMVRRESGSVYQLFEPSASLIISPYGGNSEKIPNEDSLDVEFDENNLLKANRFAGLDRIEGGPRINYGLKWGVFGAKGGNSTVFLGQSYRIRSDSTFAEGSGLEDNFSDIVGKVTISPTDSLNLLYRTRLNKENLEPRRNEVSLAVGRSALSFQGNYSFFDRQAGSEFAGREELSLSLRSKLSRFWRGTLSSLTDLDNDGGLRSIRMNLTYEDECLQFSTDISRTFFEDRDLTPTDAIFFRVLFKTLGEVKSGITRSQ